MSPRHETACFSNVNEEYAAAIESAAVFDVSGRTRLQMTGADAASFLHRFCTNQLQSLSPGQGCEAFLCNVKGRILGHVFAFTGDGRVRIETAPEQAEALIAHLEKYHLLEDFNLSDVTGETFEFLVSGNTAASQLDSLGLNATSLQPLCWQAAAEVTVRRVDLLRTPGFLIEGPAAKADEVWKQLTNSGLIPAGHDAFTALRIEAGFPEYGRDLTEDNIAQEANRTAEAISFTKGCYLGQEPIARLHAMGHVNRELTIVELDDDGSIDRESEDSIVIQHPDKPEKQIGAMTSIAFSPGRNRTVGLGMLRSQFAKPGTVVPLVAGGTACVVERR